MVPTWEPPWFRDVWTYVIVTTWINDQQEPHPRSKASSLTSWMWHWGGSLEWNRKVPARTPSPALNDHFAFAYVRVKILFCSLLYLWWPEPCLAHSEYSVNICWMNKKQWVLLNRTDQGSVPSIPSSCVGLAQATKSLWRCEIGAEIQASSAENKRSQSQE